MDICGHYNWVYVNGNFPVCLRPSGDFIYIMNAFLIN